MHQNVVGHVNSVCNSTFVEFVTYIIALLKNLSTLNPKG